MERVFFAIFISLFTVCALGTFGALEKNQTDLEIYTENNIYYINGLTVKNEMNDDVLTFDSMQDLKTYVSRITANDLKQ